MSTVEDLVGRRVRHRYERERYGTIQSADKDTGMIRVWWDGGRCPSYDPTAFTAPENIEKLRTT